MKIWLNVCWKLVLLVKWISVYVCFTAKILHCVWFMRFQLFLYKYSSFQLICVFYRICAYIFNNFMPFYEYIRIINVVGTVLPKAMHELGGRDGRCANSFHVSSISAAQVGNSLPCKAVICSIWDIFIGVCICIKMKHTISPSLQMMGWWVDEQWTIERVHPVIGINLFFSLLFSVHYCKISSFYVFFFLILKNIRIFGMRSHCMCMWFGSAV